MMLIEHENHSPFSLKPSYDSNVNKHPSKSLLEGGRVYTTLILPLLLRLITKVTLFPIFNLVI